MTTTAETLVDLVVAALSPDGTVSPPKAAPTDAGARVQAYRAWPLQAPYGPRITIDLPEEDKEGFGGAAAFNTTVALTVRGYVSSTSPATAPTDTEDGGEVRVRQALMTLRRQIEVAVIGEPALMGKITKISAVHTKMQATMDGNGYHLAELAMQLQVSFYQGPEDFFPEVDDDIDTLHIDVEPPSLPGVDVPIDIDFSAASGGQLDFSEEDNSGLLSVL